LAVFDVIKFNGIANRNWLVYHYPGDSFTLGTQLVVGEGQVAVFVKGGRALDYFQAGTYTLNTNNIPLLQSIINMPFGGRTPFTAEVYFINRTVKLDLLWGTTDPINLIDPKYNVRMRVRAFGQMGLRIVDYRVFLTELIGSVGDYQIVKFDNVMNYFKGLLVNKVKTIIADFVINQKVSVMEIAPKLEEISEICVARVSEEFNRFGIEPVNFYISSVNFPDEDFELINRILSEKAAFEIIGDNRYNVKRSFDVMEAAANNDASGNMAAAGMGLGIGAGAGITVGQTFAKTAGEVVTVGSKTISCSKCGTANTEDSKFCSNCGGRLVPEKVECGSCKTMVDKGVKFCPNCGTSMMKKNCPNCGFENIPGTKFCSECGTRLEG
jgi:membrane protease subunit (stomatin/prohibitin family)